MDVVDGRMLFGSDPVEERYDGITFNQPGDFYNQKAPPPVVAFGIGGALAVLTVVYWFVFRWLPLRKILHENHWNKNFTLQMRSLVETFSRSWVLCWISRTSR